MTVINQTKIVIKYKSLTQTKYFRRKKTPRPRLHISEKQQPKSEKKRKEKKRKKERKKERRKERKNNSTRLIKMSVKSQQMKRRLVRLLELAARQTWQNSPP